VSLRLYNTSSREIRDFVPLREGQVGIYHCGLTVQSAPHVGHIRKEVVFDVLRRWFERSGYAVTVIANVTDIDDKILVKSEEQGLPWWALAYANERELHIAYDILG
jgi:cysteinyl-tRNA synthetase